MQLRFAVVLKFWICLPNPLVLYCCVHLQIKALNKNIGRWKTTWFNFHILHFIYFNLVGYNLYHSSSHIDALSSCSFLSLFKFIWFKINSNWLTLLTTHVHPNNSPNTYSSKATQKLFIKGSIPGHSRLSTFIMMRFGWGTNVRLCKHKFRAFLCDYANDSSTTEVRPRLTLTLTQHRLRFIPNALYLDPTCECLNAICREESKDRTQLATLRTRFANWVFFFFPKRRNLGFFLEIHWFRDLYFACFWTILVNPPLFQS